MRSNILIFVVAFLLGFGGGYLIFNQSGKDTAQTDETQTTGKEEATDEQSEETASVPAEAKALSENSCLNCHAVSSAGLEGGTTGPDLSNAYKDIEGKHGKDLDSFLQEPTSAVMSGVIAENPLSEEDRKEIVEFLKTASEK